MKLRHYLKGLGLGMIVTALILHFSVYAAEPSMTDEEVMARARELGMIENVVLSRNDPTLSGNDSVSDGNAAQVSENQVSVSEDDAEHDENAQEEDAGLPSDGDADDGSDTGTVAAADSDNGSDTGKAGTDTDTDAPGREDSSDTSENGNMADGDPAEEELPAAGDAEETEPQEGMTSVEIGQDGVSFTIYNGDSSVSVAGRLAELGLVSSQAEYDAYLCSHGYDRTIRTGVHTIPAGATEQQIAEIITSKP